MGNSRYAVIDIHILGIFHPDCNIPEQTPPEGKCMITADKKQEKYTLKTSLRVFSFVGGYSEAACCCFFFTVLGGRYQRWEQLSRRNFECNFL